MAYQAIYRKYRPTSFEEIVGQKHIIQTLQNAIHKDRIAHAYLFCGPRGTGKTSTAKIFARTLNCTSDHKPCLTCENCRMSLDGSHPDIIEIDAASNNGVDEVRSLVERVGYAPMYGKYKIYIIDEVHMMTTGAFNALLKTIEEPPEFVIFIFATTEPNKVLPTILSRCQRFDFTKVSESEIAQQIQTICSKEQIQITREASHLIASLADGGMRDALSILDQCIAYQPDGITADSVREIYGVIQIEDIGRIFSNLSCERTEEAVNEISDLYDNGMDLKRFTADLITLLKYSLIYDLSEKSQIIPEGYRNVIKNSVIHTLPKQRILLLNDLMDIYQKLGYASNILDYVQTILLKYAYSLREEHQEINVTTAENPKRESEKRSDFRSDPAKKAEKVSNHRTISSLASQFWNSDVSRETLSTNYDQKTDDSFSQEMLLGLLCAGNKSYRKTDTQKFSHLNAYMTNPTWARYAAILNGMNLVASGESFLLGSFSKRIQAQEVNQFQKNDGFECFTEEILGTRKKIFAITNQEQKTLIQAFTKRMKEGNLPEPYVVNLKQTNLEKEKKEENPLELIKEVFPDITIEEN